MNDKPCWQKDHLARRSLSSCSKVPSEHLHELNDLIMESLRPLRRVEFEDWQINNMNIEWHGGNIH